jgi:hypothetical protein
MRDHCFGQEDHAVDVYIEDRRDIVVGSFEQALALGDACVVD